LEAARETGPLFCTFYTNIRELFPVFLAAKNLENTEKREYTVEESIERKCSYL